MDLSSDIQKMLGEEPKDVAETTDQTGEGGEQTETLPENSETGESAEPEETGAEAEGDAATEEGPDSALSRRFEALERTNQLLLEKIEGLKKGETKEEEAPKPKEFEPITISIDQETYDAALTNRGDFEKLLSKVATDSARIAYNKAREDTMKGLPDIIDNQVTGKVVLQSTIKTFYDNNKDLVPHRGFVQFVYEELATQNPGKSPLEIIEKDLSKAVRRKLGIKTQQVPQTQQRKGNIAPSTSGRQVQSTRPTNSIGAEIEKMGRVK